MEKIASLLTVFTDFFAIDRFVANDDSPASILRKLRLPSLSPPLLLGNSFSYSS